MPTVLRGGQIDPRGMRFAASVTTAVLAAVLIWQSTILLTLQVIVFAIAAIFGVRRSPYSWLYATFVRPRLGPPAETEDARPPQFAQAVGLAFSAVALLGFALGSATVGLIAVGFALAAAFLNAAFGFCLGCELYLVIIRISPARRRAGNIPTEVSA